MARHINGDWNLPEKLMTWSEVEIALLMDIRDELRGLKRTIRSIQGCSTTNAALRAWGDFGREQRKKERAKRKRAADQRKARRRRPST